MITNLFYTNPIYFVPRGMEANNYAEIAGYYATNIPSDVYATNFYVTNLYTTNLFRTEHWWQHQVDAWWIPVAILAAAAVTYLALATIRNKW